MTDIASVEIKAQRHFDHAYIEVSVSEWSGITRVAVEYSDDLRAWGPLNGAQFTTPLPPGSTGLYFDYDLPVGSRWYRARVGDDVTAPFEACPPATAVPA